MESVSGMKKLAFTLVELLVVVAVVATLAALLLPALGMAKAKAKEISCVNNLKQLAATELMYLDDYGVFTAADLGCIDPERPTTWIAWELIIREYLQNLYAGKMKSDAARNFLRCPGWLPNRTPLQTTTSWTDSYDLSGHIHGSCSYATKANILKRPFVLIMDGLYSSSHTCVYTSVNWDFRHTGKRLNISWTDGHVSCANWPDVPLGGTNPGDRKYWDPRL